MTAALLILAAVMTAATIPATRRRKAATAYRAEKAALNGRRA